MDLDLLYIFPVSCPSLLWQRAAGETDSRLLRLRAVQTALTRLSLCGVPAIWLALEEKCVCVWVFGCSACEHMCKRSSDVGDPLRC